MPKTEEHDHRYVRGIQEITADVANAQRRVDAALAELDLAREMLNNAQQAFIAHCREIEMPFEITPTLYPAKQYVLED